jgi:hypothetical protein
MKVIPCAFLPPLLVLLTGCGTPSVETGDRDRDVYPESAAQDQPASLFEMNFGGGETEVTKNLPGDAAEKVGDAVRSIHGKSPPEVVGE